MPNVGGWYKRKWNVYIPTDEEDLQAMKDISNEVR